MAAAVEKRFLARSAVFLDGTTVLALSRLARGRDDEAHDLAESLVAHMLETGNPYGLAFAQAFLAEIALRRGRMAEALGWAREVEPGPIHPTLSYMPHLTLAKVLIWEGRPEGLSRAEEAGQAEVLTEERSTLRSAILRTKLYRPDVASDFDTDQSWALLDVPVERAAGDRRRPATISRRLPWITARYHR